MTGEFINVAINEAFLLYNANKDKTNSIEYNGFLVTVIRMLIIICGEEIVSLFNNHDDQAFKSLLNNYGNADDFSNHFLKTYKALERQKEKAIKKKNKYFNLVQKDLIDMLVKKNSQAPMDKNTILEFYNMLYTANNNDFYRKSIALLEAYNPYEIDEYFKKFNLI